MYVYMSVGESGKGATRGVLQAQVDLLVQRRHQLRADRVPHDEVAVAAQALALLRVHLDSTQPHAHGTQPHAARTRRERARTGHAAAAAAGPGRGPCTGGRAWAAIAAEAGL